MLMPEPPNVKSNESLRYKIIKDILNDKKFIEENISNPPLKRTKKELASRINEYAIRNGLWQEGINAEMLLKDLGFIMGRREK
jgi:hypothetical protein